MQYSTGILCACKVLSKYTFFACMLQIDFAFLWLLVQMGQKKNSVFPKEFFSYCLPFFLCAMLLLYNIVHVRNVAAL